MSDLPARDPDLNTAFAAGFQHLLNEYVELTRLTLVKATNPIEADELMDRTFLVYADGVQFLQQMGEKIEKSKANGSS